MSSKTAWVGFLTSLGQFFPNGLPAELTSAVETIRQTIETEQRKLLIRSAASEMVATNEQKKRERIQQFLVAMFQTEMPDADECIRIHIPSMELLFSLAPSLPEDVHLRIAAAQRVELREAAGFRSIDETSTANLESVWLSN